MQARNPDWLVPYPFILFPCPGSLAEDSLKGALAYLAAKLGREIEKSLGGRCLIIFMLMMDLGFYRLSKGEMATMNLLAIVNHRGR